MIFTLVITGLFALYPAAGHAETEHSTVILRYDRIGTDPLYPDSIRKEELITHVKELRKNRFKVIPLIEALQTLPASHTASIVIDHADAHTIDIIEKIIDTYQLPVTLLLSDDTLTRPAEQAWYRLKDEKRITFGILPNEQETLVNKTPQALAASINQTVNKYRDVFNASPSVFAYPKGEYSNQIKQQLASYQFAAALTRNSGAVHPHSDPLALPSIVIDKSYAPAEQFMLAVRTLPLYVTDLLPEDSLIHTPAPVIGFTLDPALKNPENIACFASDIGRLNLKLVAKNRVEIRPKKPFIYRNTRIKCTLPDHESTGATPQYWRSFSITLTNPSIVEEPDVASLPK